MTYSESTHTSHIYVFFYIQQHVLFIFANIFTGGANVRNQIKRLRDQKPQIIVATPGRLAELVFQLRKLRLGMVRAVIIDEVDSMLKEPFIGEILTLIEATAMFRKEGGSEREREMSKKDLEKKEEMGSYGYMGESESERESGSESGEVDDNDSRYDDDSDINLDDTEDDEDEEDNDEDNEENEGEGEGEGEDEIPSHLNKRLVCLSSATVNDPSVRAFAEKYCSPGWVRVVVPSASMLPAGE